MHRDGERETLNVFCMTGHVNISRNFLLTGRREGERKD